MKSNQNKPVKKAANPTSEPAGDAPERIARRAHELYLERGGEHGHALDDWVQAEREILGSSQKEDDS